MDLLNHKINQYNLLNILNNQMMSSFGQQNKNYVRKNKEEMDGLIADGFQPVMPPMLDVTVTLYELYLQ